MPNSTKPTLTYTLHHVPRREAALFDSFVRIINTRTLHHWQLRPDAPIGEADLSVFYDEPHNLELLDTNRPSLLIGRQPGKTAEGHCLYLTVPLRSDRLEQCLNHLGQHLHSSDTLISQWEDTTPSIPEERTLQLLRWPPHQLLASKAQVRLAALLTGAPLTLEKLSMLSGLPSEECLSFVHLLEQHNLLVYGAPLPALSAATPSMDIGRKTAGLLARIRRSLGLKPLQVKT